MQGDDRAPGCQPTIWTVVQRVVGHATAGAVHAVPPSGFSRSSRCAPYRLGAESDACLSPTVTSEALPLPRLSEKLFAIGKAIGLEKEAEQHRAVGRNRLVLIAGRAPHELTGPAFAFMVLQRSFDHIGLFECGVLMEWHDGARFELEQGRGDAGAVRIEDLD